jgi:hypothetical protein
MTFKSKELIGLVASGIADGLITAIVRSEFDAFVDASVNYRILTNAPASRGEPSAHHMRSIDDAFVRLSSCRRRLSDRIDQELVARGMFPAEVNLDTSSPPRCRARPSADGATATTGAGVPVATTVKSMVFDEAIRHAASRTGHPTTTPLSILEMV